MEIRVQILRPQISISGFMADKVSHLDYAKLLNMDNDDLHPRGSSRSTYFGRHSCLPRGPETTRKGVCIELRTMG